MRWSTPAALAACLLLLCAPADARRRSTLADALKDLVSHPPVDPNAPVVVGFSPAGNGYAAEDVVIQAINEAHTSVHMAAYSFTSKRIAAALIAARQRGVEVAVVVDRKENQRKYTAATFIANEGVPTRLDGEYAIMHNKFVVVDEHSVETGSFNFTEAAARKNAENALLMRHVPELASQYDREWRRLWAESESLAPRY